MQQDPDTISEILLNCEEKGTAPKYFVNEKTYQQQKTSFFSQPLPVRTEPVIYNSNGEEIFVVSDLHIASGRNSIGIYTGTENFFADNSFYRFLEYANGIKKTTNALLVINGDIFDFLRVTEYPGKSKKIRPVKKLKYLLKGQILKDPKEPPKELINDEYDNWVNELKKVGIIKTREDLENCISEKEKIYGLRTDDFKTIYKLIKIKRGHPDFFKALSIWLNRGNKIIIVKGNHDLELYWLTVRNYLRLIIAEGIVKEGDKNMEDVFKKNILPNITFIDDSVEIDKDFYVEHGHRYDKFCAVLNEPVLKSNPSQMNIPFGSFFNRYLINKIELFFPFLDNVRPSGNVLPILMRENFALGIKVLVQHIPLLIRILFTNFRYVRFMLGKVSLFLIAILLPIVLIVIINWSRIISLFEGISKVQEGGGMAAKALELGMNLLALIPSYLLSRLVAWFHLSEPSSLDKFAKLRLENTNYKIITMGHTHNPGEYLFKINNDYKRFYNTGTWIPVIETSTAEVREDKTFTFLHLIRDDSGKLRVANNNLLQRWNDDAGRPEMQILIQRK
jgi:UDP-2,3-diacylglucosamine pyrophosphatase LpxH